MRQQTVHICFPRIYFLEQDVPLQQSRHGGFDGGSGLNQTKKKHCDKTCIGFALLGVLDILDYEGCVSFY
jgi:hypothetical protein